MTFYIDSEIQRLEAKIVPELRAALANLETFQPSFQYQRYQRLLELRKQLGPITSSYDQNTIESLLKQEHPHKRGMFVITTNKKIFSDSIN